MNVPWVRRRRKVWGSTAWTTGQELTAVFATVWGVLCAVGAAMGNRAFLLASLFTGGVVFGLLLAVRLGWHSGDADPVVGKVKTLPPPRFKPSVSAPYVTVKDIEIRDNVIVECELLLRREDGEPPRGDWR
jgi:hypothetical protein